MSVMMAFMVWLCMDFPVFNPCAAFAAVPDAGARGLGLLGGVGRVLAELRRGSAVFLPGMRQPRPQERGQVLRREAGAVQVLQHRGLPRQQR